MAAKKTAAKKASKKPAAKKASKKPAAKKGAGKGKALVGTPQNKLPRAGKGETQKQVATRTRNTNRAKIRVTSYGNKMNDVMRRAGIDPNNADQVRQFAGTRVGKRMAATLAKKARVSTSRE